MWWVEVNKLKYTVQTKTSLNPEDSFLIFVFSTQDENVMLFSKKFFLGVVWDFPDQSFPNSDFLPVFEKQHNVINGDGLFVIGGPGRVRKVVIPIHS